MKGRQRAALVGALVITMLSGSSATATEATDNSVMLDPTVDPNPDLEVIAKSRGWTIEQAAAQQRAADVVGALAVKIAGTHPEVFVGSALSEIPGGPPTIYIKGPADADLRDLVAASAVKIILADRQPFSFDELESRKDKVHQALEAAGFRNVMTRVNITGGGMIPAAVAPEPGLSTAADDILSMLPEDLRESVELTVTDADGFQDTTSFGGMWMRDSGDYWCTSGFTVRKLSTGTVGVTTAGHCPTINEIVHPGHGVHTTSRQAQHRGDYGDVEWHTTNATEEGTFYAETTTIRPVMYLEPRSGISVGEQVCQYGRASDYRDCLEVYDVSIACTLSGVYNNRLVQMDRITSVKGDSGGPWFRDYRVFGSQKGWCFSKDAFSVADLYDEALGVGVVIYE